MSYFSFIFIFFSVFITLLGFVIGSFLNVVIYRTPMGRTISKGHSMCMTCSHELAAKDLVPVFSWVFLGGKCRYCKAPIPSRYCKIESLTGFFFLLTTLLHLNSITFLEILSFYGTFNFGAFAIFLYHMCYMISGCAIISAMMIWYDTSKCFLRLPVTSVSLGLFAQIFVSIAQHADLKAILLTLVLKFARVLILPAVAFVIFKLFRKNYSMSELYMDLSFGGILIYSFYVLFANEWILTACFAVVFSLLRVLTIDKKLNRYVGIIGAGIITISFIISGIKLLVFTL